MEKPPHNSNIGALLIQRRDYETRLERARMALAGLDAYYLQYVRQSDRVYLCTGCRAMRLINTEGRMWRSEVCRSCCPWHQLREALAEPESATPSASTPRDNSG